ncbi:acyl-CoA dehydrogenase [Variovorax sp. NFACC27]|uniref:acyl-CoA dehydrogenase n=1 Tax=unclassified Variovorax TaxID=663243 RepID=UPI0008958617|nr:acyl-CoA dehydrogenase [Variovorax sp. NFACC28]SEG96124.1 acyl-CoA dehydrogenase [Variovorax sp. NFACC29]SFD82465.1 acyl-CoA dehydrogenase [Variovorax sp. NFACC26]SFG94595.1 acyl-CoA dehydrogenase [Variovorax sp. NFACC27]
MPLASLIGRWAMQPFSKALPPLGDTERAALEAGTVGFEGRLFAGRPDFDVLAAMGPNRLDEREQRFLDNEVRELCRMLDDHAIDEAHDLPPEVWRFLREKRFFGMIIPEEFGGLGFGHHAHATVVARIATVNVATAVTVMVPNSLGPAELLLRYGTNVQKAHYLPRLADGRELPCFGLTSPYAGSDAASIPDRGVLVEREIGGRTKRGFLVDFDKRYITLAPVATVVGLAFHAIDESRPEGERELGITCALIPVPQAGMEIGRRHHPMDSAFMNGPIRGRQVFVPMEWIIGGEPQVGQGWRMLMECLAAGRAISLPALGSAMQQTALYVANGYGRIREQFGMPVGRFHAVAGLVAQMSAELYASDAARRFTAAALDKGERPSVASAILKVQLTEAGRRAVNRGMDILGGKGIISGPSNLLGVAYRQAPIAITVEGANILTRALIVFGQGAVRCHPHVLDEMAAVQAGDEKALGKALMAHGRHVALNLWRSLFAAPVLGSPPDDLMHEARLIARMSAKYALTADLAMGLLGGKLKRMELLSARLGDVLAHLYLASACVWRYRVEVAPEMLPFARAAIRLQIDEAGSILRDLYANLPTAGRRVIGALVLRRTAHLAPLRDVQLLELAELLRKEPRIVARLAPDLSEPAAGGLLDLMHAMELGTKLGEGTAALNKVLRRTNSLEEAASSAPDPELALAYLKAADKVIQVDDFEGPPRDAQGRADLRPAAAAAPPGQPAQPPSARPPERTIPPRVPAA